MKIELSVNIKGFNYSRWKSVQKRDHRRKGKSFTSWYNNGQKASEAYHINGGLHRRKGPAVTRWFANGQKEYEGYYVNGEYHNAKGPARTSWSLNGQKYYESYYLNGRLLTKEEWEECK